MKKTILLILSGLILFAFILLISILWYNFFYNNNESINTISSINIQLGDNNTIDEDYLMSTSETDISSITPYEFSVMNEGEASITYEVKIEDKAITDNTDYLNKELISRNLLMYQLSLNNQVIKEGKLSELEENTLDTRNISANQINNYELRIYVESSIQDSLLNKYYHFNINIQTEEK